MSEKDREAVRLLRWRLSSALGTTDPDRVEPVPILSPDEALILIQRIRRLNSSEAWSDAEEPRRWLRAIEQSTRWDQVVSPHGGLDLRRRQNPDGSVTLDIVDRDLEAARRRDLVAPISLAPYDPSWLKTRWKQWALPRWVRWVWLGLMICALFLMIPWAIRPLPRTSDAALAGALLTRVAGLFFGTVFAPIGILWRLRAIYTIIPRRPPMPRGAHGLH